jgi:sodium/proline symporter
MIYIFAAYLLIILVIAFISSRRTKTSKDFVLGDKNISGFSLALSERAAGESAWLLLGLTGLAFTQGLSAVWVAVGCVIGILFIWIVMAHRLREETDRTGALTLPGLISKKFPGTEKTVGFFSALIIFFFFLFYIAAQFSGAGEVLNLTFGIAPFWGKIIGSLIVTFYCMLGGFLTVVIVDVFQAFLMILTLIVLPGIALVIAASLNLSVAATMEQAGPAISSLTAGQTGAPAVIMILSGLSWALGYTGQPHLLVRMMAMRSKKDITVAINVASVWTVFAYIGALLIGIMGFVLLQNNIFGPNETSAILQNHEKVMPVLSIFLFHPLIAGVLLSGAISAMISTASSQLIVASTAVSEDVLAPTGLRKISEKNLLNFNKLITILVGIVAFILAITSSDTVYSFVSYAWSGIGSSFGPALVLLLFWKKFSRAGVYASLFFGTVGSIVWKNWLMDPTGISERLASYVIAFSMAVLFSLIFPEKENKH